MIQLLIKSSARHLHQTSTFECTLFVLLAWSGLAVLTVCALNLERRSIDDVFPRPPSQAPPPFYPSPKKNQNVVILQKSQSSRFVAKTVLRPSHEVADRDITLPFRERVLRVYAKECLFNLSLFIRANLSTAKPPQIPAPKSLEPF